tara:strand:- start:15 stop:635 length:621 start_codon:yes stop_codon:yes gene_type:complete
VRVFDFAFEEPYSVIKQGFKRPKHMSNSLYLEWFSGRVVVESGDYELRISEPAWHMTDEQDRQRAEDAIEGFHSFMGRMTEATDQATEKVDYEKEDWDEFGYERFMNESDAKTDKFTELLDKFRHNEASFNKAANEMGWKEIDDEGLSTESFETEQQEWIEASDVEFEPATEGVDWIRIEKGDLHHPIQQQCFTHGIALTKELEES